MGVCGRCSASLGVALCRCFGWSRRVSAGQGSGVGFMACKRSGVRIPIAPPGHAHIFEQSSNGISAPEGHFRVGLRAAGLPDLRGSWDGPALSAMPGIDDVQEVKGSDARCTEQTPRSRGGHRTALGALGHGTRRPGVAAERGGADRGPGGAQRVRACGPGRARRAWPWSWPSCPPSWPSAGRPHSASCPCSRPAARPSRGAAHARACPCSAAGPGPKPCAASG